ncbi:MAG: DNA-directed RNA polymerase subunit beta, partial [candidate division Zixibacteria bacterium]|nr:DNA-directed RNA polymerase subunit beta [candidate division Zixibacteria bacterium]
MARKERMARINYGRINDAAEMPNLLDIQLESYHNFLQANVPIEKRQNQGLQQIFSEIFPVTDVKENFVLEFVNYSLGTARYSTNECRERNMTYGAPLRATLRLVSKQGEGEEKQVRDVIEQDVYLGELPLITEWGTFIINGAERVIVSQLHRSPGVFFDEETHPNGKVLFSARIIPYRGSWVEFVVDINDIMYVYIDSRRKLPVTTLLRAVGYATDEELISNFYKTAPLEIAGKKEDA